MSANKSSHTIKSSDLNTFHFNYHLGRAENKKCGRVLEGASLAEAPDGTRLAPKTYTPSISWKIVREAGPLRLDPGRACSRPGLLRLVQHRTSPQRPRPAHAPRRALRLGRAARGRARRRARHGLCGPPRAVSRRPSGAGRGAHRGLDQSLQAARARGGRAHSLNSITDCLIPIDRFRCARAAKSRALNASRPTTTNARKAKKDHSATPNL